ncbi:MAG: hypothetical protein IIB37_12120 [Gemmatimonadetes bacterium]|nr:hypothetical protein [Gemmatimonadota bacterium]MCH7934796.1 hypothetical protein [Gemmatimonadota bacterium]
MNSQAINTSDMAARTVTRVGRALLVGGILFAAQPLAAQSFDMNFFLVIQGPTWGPDEPDVEISDSHCYDQGYAEGFGHLTWRAYLTGSAEDGEEGEVARERIGKGPWYNYHGIMIAEDVAQLHSDENNLWLESAVTVKGLTAPEDVLEIPWGSQLDGGDFSRDGPFLCFGVPQ